MNYKVGDVVKLKSGGPLMTIESFYKRENPHNTDQEVDSDDSAVVNNSGTDSVICIWFISDNAAEAIYGSFLLDTLVKQDM